VRKLSKTVVLKSQNAINKNLPSKKLAQVFCSFQRKISTNAKLQKHYSSTSLFGRESRSDKARAHIATVWVYCVLSPVRGITAQIGVKQSYYSLEHPRRALPNATLLSGPLATAADTAAAAATPLHQPPRHYSS